MKDQNSRFYPCAMIHVDGRCGGIAALIKAHYTCQRCGAMWDIGGEQLTEGVAS